MARIKYGSIISDISGSVGSATFQKSLYGNTLRNRPRPHKTGTAAQMSSRAILMQCQYAWQSLVSATRKQWDQYIAFSGASINRDRGILMTGHSLFLKYNYARLLQGFAILYTPTYISSPPWPSCVRLRAINEFIFIEFSSAFPYALAFPHLLLSPKRHASLSFSARQLRFLPLNSYTLNHTILQSTYNNVFGTNLSVGDIIHVRCKLFSFTAPVYSHTQSAIITVTV